MEFEAGDPDRDSPRDSQRLTPPRIYLLRIAVFLILVGFVAFILYRQILTAFNANPGLNALIVGVLGIGILFTVRQVFRLFREVRWVNRLREHEPIAERDAPVLLGPIATMLGETAGRTAISTGTLRALLDSIGSRLDEGRDVSRYLAGVLVFLGLLGTFWGLLETVSSVARVIQSMGGGGTGDTTQLFDELKTGLAAPLGGMGISFSSSLFGLAGSLVLGFLDLQAGQAQNRFYNELEDYLAGITQHAADASPLALGPGGSPTSRRQSKSSRRPLAMGARTGPPPTPSSILPRASRASCNTCARSSSSSATGWRRRPTSRTR